MNTFKLKNLEDSSYKEFYNLDKEMSATKWIGIETKGLKSFDAPQMTTSLNYTDSANTMKGKLVKNNLGYFFNHSNNIKNSNIYVSLFSSCYKDAQGVSIIKENFLKVCALFCARRACIKKWYNERDEFIKPRGTS